MPFVTPDLEKRSEQATELEAEQYDGNMTKLEAAIDALNTWANAAEQYAEMYQSANATATNCAIASTWYLAAGTWAADETDGPTFSVGDSALILSAGDWVCHAVISFTGVATHTYRFAFAIDGVPVTKHIARGKVAAADVQFASLVGVLRATAGQKLTLMVYDDGGTGSVTISDVTVVAIKKHA